MAPSSMLQMAQILPAMQTTLEKLTGLATYSGPAAGVYSSADVVSTLPGTAKPERQFRRSFSRSG